ncbi:hypothetical protein ACROYT_G012363 [Oculina patagonica]
MAVDISHGLEVGSIVEVPVPEGLPRYGVIRWLGNIPQIKDKLFAGMELEVEQAYCSDGIFNGDRYFTCPPGRGFFTFLEHCRPDSRLVSDAQARDASCAQGIESNQMAVDIPHGLEVGSMVEVPMAEGFPRYGVIRWLGNLPQLKDKLIAGLELENELASGSNGIFGGERYFTCPAGKGFFTLLEHCRPDSRLVSDAQASDASCAQGDHFRSTPPNSSIKDNGPITKWPGFSNAEFRSQDTTRKMSYPDYVHFEKDDYENVMDKHGSSSVYREKDLNENSQRRLSEMEQHLTNVQRQLQEKELQAAKLHGQVREKCQQEENLQRQLRAMEQQVTRMVQRVTRMGQQVTRMEQELREKNLEIENSERLSREKVQQLTDFQVQLGEKDLQEARLHEQLREKEQQLRESDEHGETLQRQLRELEQQGARMEQEMREKDEQKENLQRQLRELEQQLTNSQRHLIDQEQESAHLQQQVVTLEEELRAKHQDLNEMEITLSTVRQALTERQRQQTPDWVISRDQIQLTDKFLGRGGWGSVVQGKYCGCVVAVKQIHELILSPHNRILFEREMDIASRCRHPCLLQFIGATNDEGSPLFLTELMESSLRVLLEQRPLAATEVLVISLDVARALSYLHKKTPSPIIHRDISSANVLLWRQGDQWRGKVSDYGTANFMQQTMTVAPGAMIYIAPEALTSNQTVKVDVYSFGVLLCEMCIRELPDPERRDQQIAMVENRLLRALVRRCVQTEPGARPNMEEIIEELEEPI